LDDLKSSAQDDLANYAAQIKAKVEEAFSQGHTKWRCSSKLDASSCKDCGGKWKSMNGCVKPNSSNRSRIRSATSENQETENRR